MIKHDLKILLVEDNEGDILLMLEAFSELRISNEIVVKKDGQLAIEYLTDLQKNNVEELPNLILLDINLPRLSGKDVLAQIKSTPLLSVIPVIMITTSNSERDIAETYLNHVNCYVSKPVDFEQFLELVQLIKKFWIDMVQYPKEKQCISIIEK